ncbi:unnamed protein product [Lactuca virosa]|uniref:Uncharacterized protein n=1 Tax=Lactuca virosa TaxID=75947 RepID=A0AAU9LJP0_9ASTR|nr:unnamed protein product [Lactuca virosa]
MYYYLPNQAIIDGLKELRYKDDYVRFLDVGYINDCKTNIYIDHYHKTIMEWIEEEKSEKGDNASETYEDDVDSIMSDDISVDHEVEEEVIEILKSFDLFLSKKNLIPEGGVDDEVVQFRIYDPNQK